MTGFYLKVRIISIRIEQEQKISLRARKKSGPGKRSSGNMGVFYVLKWVLLTLLSKKYRLLLELGIWPDSHKNAVMQRHNVHTIFFLFMKSLYFYFCMSTHHSPISNHQSQEFCFWTIIYPMIFLAPERGFFFLNLWKVTYACRVMWFPRLIPFFFFENRVDSKLRTPMPKISNI